MERKDEIGNRYGCLLVESLAGLGKNGKALWWCICDCGVITVKGGKYLRAGLVKSCGRCDYKSLICAEVGARRRTHGHSRAGQGGAAPSPTYVSWSSMKNRCQNPKADNYPMYGGRGIKVCDRWLGTNGFENFLADLGERPLGCTLGRLDPNGDYEPSNCAWQTTKQQGRNKRIIVKGNSATGIDRDIEFINAAFPDATEDQLLRMVRLIQLKRSELAAREVKACAA